jgi:uncharacterized repeat protein (TIGR02543 family)
MAGTRTGYTFDGWTVYPAGVVTFASASLPTTSFNMPTTGQNVIVRANWTSLTQQNHTLTMAGLGTGGTPTGVTQRAAGAVVPITAGTRVGYTFAGWTVYPAGAGAFTNASAASTNFTMPSQNVTVTATWTATPPAAPVITTNTLPNGNVNTFYSATLAATGSTPITWSIVTGTLPPGLNLNAATGLISGTPTQTGTSTFTIRAANNLGNDDRQFTITINQQQAGAGTHTLTLRAGTGGRVALGSYSYSTSVTGNFAPGTRITISARPNRDYHFDEWTSTRGEFTNEFRAETTFIMPDRDVTVTAHFYGYWDWRDRDWRGGRPGALPPVHWTPTPPPPPVTLPTVGFNNQQQNHPATDSASFILSMPGIANGYHPISISGLPAGVTAPTHARVFNNELQVHLMGISNAVAGNHPLFLTVYDNNGNAITVPVQFMLTTSGLGVGSAAVQPLFGGRNELILSVGNTAYIRNGVLVQNDAAPFIDPVDNRLMVPLRVIAEGLGAQVTWLGELNTVLIQTGATPLSLTVGVPLPGGMGTPVNVNGRIFVPARYVAEMLGATVK